MHKISVFHGFLKLVSDPVAIIGIGISLFLAILLLNPQQAFADVTAGRFAYTNDTTIRASGVAISGDMRGRTLTNNGVEGDYVYAGQNGPKSIGGIPLDGLSASLPIDNAPRYEHKDSHNCESYILVMNAEDGAEALVVFNPYLPDKNDCAINNLDQNNDNDRVAIGELVSFIGDVTGTGGVQTVSGEWIDRTRMKIGTSSDVFKAVDPLGRNQFPDDLYQFTDGSGCNQYISFNGHFSTDASNTQANANAIMAYNEPTGAGQGDCKPTVSKAVNLTHPERSLTTAYRVGADRIFMPVYVYPGGGVGGTGLFAGSDQAENGIFLTLPANHTRYDANKFSFLNSDGALDDPTQSGAYVNYGNKTQIAQTCRDNFLGCDNKATIHLVFANDGDFTTPDAAVYPNATSGAFGEAPTTADATPDAGALADVNCESISGGGALNPLKIVDHALSWIFCPLVDGAINVVNGVGNAVIDHLIIDPNAVLNTTSEAGQGIRTAWNGFRIISLSLLILVALVGIAAGSFIDAYTLKKILPRMLIAIITISLSWELMKLALSVTNAIGIGVRSLIQAPFQSVPPVTFNIENLLVGGGGVIAAGALGFVSFLALFSFVGTAALAVIMAFVFISIRYVAIIALIIAAPFAIMCSILPGTEKIWKIWKDGLVGALAMLPLVTGMLAIGAAGGKVVALLQQGVYGQLMALTVTFAPYFLIPKAFSVAGGLISNLSGMVNDKSKGAFDRLKNFRQSQNKKVNEDRKAGQRWRGMKYGRDDDGNIIHKNLRSRLNAAGQTASLVPKMGIGEGSLSQRRQMMRDNIANARDASEWDHSTHLLRENAFIRAHYQDDDTMLGVVRGEGDYQKTYEAIRAAGGARFIKRNEATGEDEEDTTELNRLTSAALRFRREAGAAADMTAARGAFTSSTAFKTQYQKNEDGTLKRDPVTNQPMLVEGTEEANVQAQRLIIKALGHHGRGNAPKMIAEMRQAQDAAGRFDVGSSSFSDTMMANNILLEMGPPPPGMPTAPPPTAPEAVLNDYKLKLQQYASTPEYQEYAKKVHKISRDMTQSIFEGKPLGAVIGGKEQAAQNIVGTALEVTSEVLRDDRQGKWGQSTPQLGKGTDTHKKAVVTELARLSGSLQAAANYSDAGRQQSAAALSTEVDLASLDDEIKKMVTLERWENKEVPVFNTDGSPKMKQVESELLKPDGSPVMKEVQETTTEQHPVYKDYSDKDGKITYGEMIKNLERTNPDMANTVKIYYEQATAAQAAQAAQATAAQVSGAVAGAMNNPNSYIPPTNFTPPSGF